MGSEIMFYIIVPIFNVEHYLRKCLDSLLAQSYTQWRAILINDGSTDSSNAIINEYAKSDNRFTLLSQDNQGQAVARNRGLECVRELISTLPPPHLA
ncbi:glycosyltransferase [Helicobacter sp. MIT 21-1697]|uniref:glycosyltransferase n=1 Tax=Helicobacter sp. MIT 21-1697 TaxID=2993733 RepID=UPI00224B7A38|nr:glycosyltransferase [Helicobacter sp. MIT 21-1697]MCX2717777.1 glycosyltransferase [Helicobacter sp. MIT 21-1697]